MAKNVPKNYLQNKKMALNLQMSKNDKKLPINITLL
jgi:hypothetical protein